jgi:hypothetical protein
MAGRSPISIDRFLLSQEGPESELGPLSAWGIGLLLAKIGYSEGAQEVAKSGYRKLSTAGFQGELTDFMSGESISSQCLQQLAAALAGDDDADLQTFARLAGSPWGTFVQESATAIRANPEKPLADVWLPVWNELWRQGLEEMIEGNLYRLMRP